MTEEEKKQLELKHQADVVAAREAEGKRRDEIDALVARHPQLKEAADKAKKDGTSIEEFRGIALTAIGSSKPLYEDPSAVDFSKKEKKEYSLLRAINSVIRNEKSFEREVSDEISKKLGMEAKGIFIPYGPLVKSKRDMGTGAGVGGELIGTDHLASQFIDVLRNKMVTLRLGVQVLSGLKSNVKIPKLLTGAENFSWKGGGAALLESNPTTGQVTLSPHRGGTFVDWEKELLATGLPSVEALLTNDILQTIALGLDYAILQGAGGDSPVGIMNTVGIGNVAGAGWTYAKTIEMIQKIMEANADVASMHWVTTPAIWGALKTKEKAANQAIYLIDQFNKMEGYDVHATQQMANPLISPMLFGNFSNSLLGLFGGIDLLVDPYTQAVNGLVRLVGDVLADHTVRNAGGFCATADFAV